MEPKPILIETDRLILKGLSPQDMAFIFGNFSKKEAMETLGHRTEDDYAKEKAKQDKGYACYNRSFLLFLLIEKTSGAILGRCGVHNWNKDHNRAEIGYMTDENFRRNGFMTEAVQAVIRYGFEQMGLHRIEALVGSRNIPSLRIIERFAFAREGLLRQHYLTPEGYEDSVVFSKLSGEHAFRQTENAG